MASAIKNIAQLEVYNSKFEHTILGLADQSGLDMHTPTFTACFRIIQSGRRNLQVSKIALSMCWVANSWPILYSELWSLARWSAPHLPLPPKEKANVNNM